MSRKSKASSPSVLFVHPPGSYVDMPSLGIPVLVGYLRQHGVQDVSVWDANLDFLEFLLSPESLKRQEDSLRAGNVVPKAKPFVGDVLFLLPHWRSWVGEALQIFHDPKMYFNVDLFGKAVHLIQNLLNCYSMNDDLAKYEFNFNGFSIGPKMEVEQTDTFAKILELVETEGAFLQIDRFLETCQAAPLQRTYDLLALSCPNPQQLLPSLMLAKFFKKSGVAKKIVIGGSFVTTRRKTLLESPRMYDYVDYGAAFEGEEALLGLVKALAGDQDLSSVPNLYFPNVGGIVQNEAKKIQDLNALPTPDFSDFSLDRYWTPEPVLPTYGSRGCSYDLCEFCNHHENYFGKFRVRSTRKVIEDIETYKTKYGSRTLFFVDELMVPKFALEIAEKVQKNDLGTRWYCHSRVESKLKEKEFAVLAKGGLSLLHVGMESANTNVLKLMEKGYQREDVLEFLGHLKNTPISTHLNIIHHFPGEQPDELIESLSTVWEYAKVGDYIHLYDFSFPEAAPLARGTNPFLESFWKESGDLMDKLSFKLKDVRFPTEEEEKTIARYHSLLGSSFKVINKIFPPECCWAAHLLYVSNYREMGQDEVLDAPLNEFEIRMKGMEAFVSEESLRDWDVRVECDVQINPSDVGSSTSGIVDLNTFRFLRVPSSLANLLHARNGELISGAELLAESSDGFQPLRDVLYTLLRMGFISIHPRSEKVSKHE